MEKQGHLGVVVGRFQVPMLHEGHRHVIDTTFAQSDHVIIGIGDTGGHPTPRNPLTYEARRAMVHEAYPDATIVMIRDQWNAAVWSQLLDRIIVAHGGARAESIKLFGSRDSFLAHYMGRYPTTFVEAKSSPSGTEIRQRIAEGTYSGMANERAGQILYQMTRPPFIYPSVHVAIVDTSRKCVLLGAHKRDGNHRRFFGADVEAADASFQHAAVRVLRKVLPDGTREALSVIGSARVDDPRYRGSNDGVLTTLFSVLLSDDAACAANGGVWVDMSALPQVLIEEHHLLGTMLLAHLAQ